MTPIEYLNGKPDQYVHISMDVPIENLNCPHCGTQHEDIDMWAQHPHKNHLCLSCGELFEGTLYAVSRPNMTQEYRERFRYHQIN